MLNQIVRRLHFFFEHGARGRNRKSPLKVALAEAFYCNRVHSSRVTNALLSRSAQYYSCNSITPPASSHRPACCQKYFGQLPPTSTTFTAIASRPHFTPLPCKYKNVHAPNYRGRPADRGVPSGVCALTVFDSWQVALSSCRRWRSGSGGRHARAPEWEGQVCCQLLSFFSSVFHSNRRVFFCRFFFMGLDSKRSKE